VFQGHYSMRATRWPYIFLAESPVGLAKHLALRCDQSDQLLSDPKKHFVCEVYFCQKKYIFDPERSTNCAKSSFSDKIIYELPRFWPLIFVKYFHNIFLMAMALGYKSQIKIRCVSHFHVPQSCMSWAQVAWITIYSKIFLENFIKYFSSF